MLGCIRPSLYGTLIVHYTETDEILDQRPPHIADWVLLIHVYVYPHRVALKSMLYRTGVSCREAW